MQQSKKVFDVYGKYYNLIYQNKNYKNEVNYIHKLIRKFNDNNKNILEFGSGTGGHAKFFVDKGYTVHGIEKSKSMIVNCKKIKGFTFQNGDVCKIKLKRKYDIVLSLFHVLSYQTREININNFFKNARYHLNLNGLFGFDFWYTNAVNAQKPHIRLIELKKKNFKLIRLAEPSKDRYKNTISVNYTVVLKNLKNTLVNVIKENHKMRHFSLSDLSRLCKKYKFKCLHVRELISNNKPSKNTWGVFCLLKKY
jgi:cyclopropane fatty-acyl-phospholipid synthase-like methyltransferase